MHFLAMYISNVPMYLLKRFMIMMFPRSYYPIFLVLPLSCLYFKLLQVSVK